MIKYIEDRDIWTKKLDLIDEFASWFHTVPLDVKEYNKYMDDNVLMEMIKTKGVAYVELNNYYVNQSLDYVVVKFTKIKDKYYFIGYINSTILKSDIGNKIFDKYPLIDFSAIYSVNDSDDSTSFSLRSTETSADVSEIAFNAFGAGGHSAAAGCRLNYISNQLGTTYDNGQLYTLLDYVYFDSIEINNIKLNIVYLNSNIHKYELSAYLLQKRYIDKNNNKDVQEVTHLYQIKTSKKDVDEFHICAIWDYDTKNDTTYYLILFSLNFNRDVKKEFLSKYRCLENDMNKRYYNFKMKGFVKILI